MSKLFTLKLKHGSILNFSTEQKEKFKKIISTVSIVRWYTSQILLMIFLEELPLNPEETLKFDQLQITKVMLAIYYRLTRKEPSNRGRKSLDPKDETRKEKIIDYVTLFFSGLASVPKIDPVPSVTTFFPQEARMISTNITTHYQMHFKKVFQKHIVSLVERLPADGQTKKALKIILRSYFNNYFYDNTLWRSVDLIQQSCWQYHSRNYPDEEMEDSWILVSEEVPLDLSTYMNSIATFSNVIANTLDCPRPLQKHLTILKMMRVLRKINLIDAVTLTILPINHLRPVHVSMPACYLKVICNRQDTWKNIQQKYTVTKRKTLTLDERNEKNKKTESIKQQKNSNQLKKKVKLQPEEKKRLQLLKEEKLLEKKRKNLNNMLRNHEFYLATLKTWNLDCKLLLDRDITRINSNINFCDSLVGKNLHVIKEIRSDGEDACVLIELFDSYWKKSNDGNVHSVDDDLIDPPDDDDDSSDQEGDDNIDGQDFSGTSVSVTPTQPIDQVDIDTIVSDEYLRKLILNGEIKDVWIGDPGLCNILAIVHYQVQSHDPLILKEIRSFRITSKQMCIESHKQKNYLKMQRLRMGYEIKIQHKDSFYEIGTKVSLKQLESILPSWGNAKSATSLLENCRIRSLYALEILKFYSQHSVMKLDFDTFSQKKSIMTKWVNDNFLNRGSSIGSSNKLVLIGGGSVDGFKLNRPTTIGSSGQFIQILRNSGITTLYVDESYSTKTCHYCKERSMKLLEHRSFNVSMENEDDPLILKALMNDPTMIDLNELLQQLDIQKKSSKVKKKRRLDPITNRRIMTHHPNNINPFEILSTYKTDDDCDVDLVDIDNTSHDDPISIDESTTTTKAAISYKDLKKQNKKRKQGIRNQKKAIKQSNVNIRNPFITTTSNCDIVDDDDNHTMIHDQDSQCYSIDNKHQHQDSQCQTDDDIISMMKPPTITTTISPMSMPILLPNNQRQCNDDFITTTSNCDKTVCDVDNHPMIISMMNPPHPTTISTTIPIGKKCILKMIVTKVRSIEICRSSKCKFRHLSRDLNPDNFMIDRICSPIPGCIILNKPPRKRNKISSSPSSSSSTSTTLSQQQSQNGTINRPSFPSRNSLAHQECNLDDHKYLNVCPFSLH